MHFEGTSTVYRCTRDVQHNESIVGKYKRVWSVRREVLEDIKRYTSWGAFFKYTWSSWTLKTQYLEVGNQLQESRASLSLSLLITDKLTPLDNEALQKPSTKVQHQFDYLLHYIGIYL